MTGAYLSLYSEDRPELGRGSGIERMCSCPSPVHEDRKPSCSVQVESGQWFCHGCGEGGGRGEVVEAHPGPVGTRSPGNSPGARFGAGARTRPRQAPGERKCSVLFERTPSLPPAAFCRACACSHPPVPLRGLLPIPHPGRDRVRPGFTATPRTGPAAKPIPTLCALPENMREPGPTAPRRTAGLTGLSH